MTALRAVGAAVLALVAVVAVLFALVSRPASAPPRTGPAPAPGGAPQEVAAGELWLAEMTLDSPDVLTDEARLRDVRMQATDVLLSGDGLRAGTLTVDAVVPFGVVAEQLGPGTTIEAADGGQARIRRTVTLLGRAVDLSATGTVRADDGLVVVEPTSVDVGGPSWLADAVGSVAARLVTIREPVEGLPPDLALQDVSVRPDGFAVRLAGQDVLLGAAP